MHSLETLPSCLHDVKPEVKQLFFQGDTNLLLALKVAIVGTRRPSLYTKNMTFALASALKDAGAVVVSGAAMGVDALAHKGAFPRTIAVMANSLDIQAPRVNKSLIDSMAKDALCLSEYPVSTHPTAYSFVQRNRIVVGLADIVIITQADLKSGSMHSAEFAMKSGKRLFVLPHHIGESLGTTQLLEQGDAQAIYSIESFIQCLNLKTQVLKENSDEILAFCASQPSYDVAVAKFKDKLFEYELLGKVEVMNGRVVVPSQHK